jgi:hypothetical protein
MLNNYFFQHSHISRTIASSQHHPRETRPLLSQPNLYENCYIGLAYVEFVSYITRNESIYLLTHFFLLSYIPFSFLYSHIMCEVESIDFAAAFFSVQQKSFFHIYVWSWVNLFAGSFFSVQPKSFFHIYVWSWDNLFAGSFFHTQLKTFFHIMYEVEQSICWLVFFRSAKIVFSYICMKLSNLFADSFFHTQLNSIFIPNFHTQQQAIFIPIFILSNKPFSYRIFILSNKPFSYRIFILSNKPFSYRIFIFDIFFW